MKKIIFTSVCSVIALAAFFSFSSGRYDKLKKTQNLNSDSADKGFAVIELYTSEGCSSCPSADVLLKQIRQSYLNKEVYVLEYHVDYWNRLGWKDKFSDHQYSERQSAYANNFKNSSVYTPQAIVNGKDQMVGSAATELKNSLSKFLGKTPNLLIQSSVQTITENKMVLDYTLPKDALNEDLVINLIQKDTTTNVKSGENGGKLLAHVNVVRDYQIVRINKLNTQIIINLPQDFKKENFGVIAFVQTKNQGEILGADQAKI